MNPVDKLQEAFNACLAIPTDDLRPSAEQNIAKFIDSARKLEVFFLQKQLLLSDSCESDNDINKLQAKLRSREALLAKCQEKLGEWKKIVD